MTHRIGGGGVADRRLIRGRSGNAGEMPKSEGIRASIGSLAAHLGLSYEEDDFETKVERAIAEEDPRLLEWLKISAMKLEAVLASICGVLDPEAIIFSGRMPLSIRAALAERVSIEGRSIDGVSAPGPTVVVDPATDCLEIGAAALPIARVFSGLAPRAPSNWG